MLQFQIKVVKSGKKDSWVSRNLKNIIFNKILISVLPLDRILPLMITDLGLPMIHQFHQSQEIWRQAGTKKNLLLSSKHLFFLRKLVRQGCTDVTSFCMQFEKWGRGLLQKAFPSEGKSFAGWKRGGKRKYWSWKMEVNIGVLPVIKANAQDLTVYVFSFFPSLFKPTKHSPSLWKASRSNPCPFFKLHSKWRYIGASPFSTKKQ